jgi:hypothetical protein
VKEKEGIFLKIPQDHISNKITKVCLDSLLGRRSAIPGKSATNTVDGCMGVLFHLSR